MLPGSGYLVIALKADNPGAWLAVRLNFLTVSMV